MRVESGREGGRSENGTKGKQSFVGLPYTGSWGTILVRVVGGPRLLSLLFPFPTHDCPFPSIVDV